PEEHVDVLTPPGLYGGSFGSAAPGAGADAIYAQSDLEERAQKADAYNSPGWARMQSRIGQRGMSQPKESRNMVIDAEAVTAFDLGERVFHQKFGYGRIEAMEGDKLTVAFEKAGVKKVVASYVTGESDVPF
ncbi:MAG: DNA helicase II, partial [Pseudomonadota bacterium]